MIGWWIVISTLSPDERAQSAERQASILASWEVGVEGLEWIEVLVTQGEASRLRRDGYPSVYVAKAAAVLPLLNDGPPRSRTGLTMIGDDYVMPPGWHGEWDIHPDRIAACPLDQQLTIEAWDLS